jgi:alkylation response protein AidB-like acyl-CoA dehydrogenase
MDLNFSLDDDALRQEVRAFLRDHYPAEMRVANPHTDLTKQQMLLWHHILHKKGWIAPSWPKKFGGAGWSVTQRSSGNRKRQQRTRSHPCRSA